MGYNNLSDSGMDDNARRQEATRIVGMIGDQMLKEMQAHEAKFVKKMENEREPVSTKQLFWLRDLKDKYL